MKKDKSTNYNHLESGLTKSDCSITKANSQKENSNQLNQTPTLLNANFEEPRRRKSSLYQTPGLLQFPFKSETVEKKKDNSDFSGSSPGRKISSLYPYSNASLQDVSKIASSHSLSKQSSSLRDITKTAPKRLQTPKMTVRNFINKLAQPKKKLAKTSSTSSIQNTITSRTPILATKPFSISSNSVTAGENKAKAAANSKDKENPRSRKLAMVNRSPSSLKPSSPSPSRPQPSKKGSSSPSRPASRSVGLVTPSTASSPKKTAERPGKLAASKNTKISSDTTIASTTTTKSGKPSNAKTSIRKNPDPKAVSVSTARVKSYHETQKKQINLKQKQTKINSTQQTTKEKLPEKSLSGERKISKETKNTPFPIKETNLNDDNSSAQASSSVVPNRNGKQSSLNPSPVHEKGVQMNKAARLRLQKKNSATTSKSIYV